MTAFSLWGEAGLNVLTAKLNYAALCRKFIRHYRKLIWDADSRRETQIFFLFYQRNQRFSASKKWL